VTVVHDFFNGDAGRNHNWRINGSLFWNKRRSIRLSLCCAIGNRGLCVKGLGLVCRRF
jgi:hypothetical protein